MNIIEHRLFDSLITKNINSDFFTAMADETLDSATYKSYLEQDGIYLFYYQIALEQTAKIAPTLKERDFFSNASQSIKLEVAASFGNRKLSLANQYTLLYIDYLMTYTREDYLQALCAIFPCFYVYFAVANQAAKISRTHLYHEWFKCYRSELFANQTEAVTRFINQALSESQDSDRYIAILTEGIELEIAFHQALIDNASLGAT